MRAVQRAIVTVDQKAAGTVSVKAERLAALVAADWVVVMEHAKVAWLVG